jgi:hypothetical protein
VLRLPLPLWGGRAKGEGDSMNVFSTKGKDAKYFMKETRRGEVHRAARVPCSMLRHSP